MDVCGHSSSIFIWNIVMPTICRHKLNKLFHDYIALIYYMVERIEIIY